jgi:queuine tRNA-ribosyltransferase
MLGPMLLTWHNIHYYQDLMRGLRAAIVAGRLEEHAAALAEGWAAGDADPHPDPDPDDAHREAPA